MTARRGVWTFVGIGMLLSLALAGVVSFYASSAPDGLEKVAGDVGLGAHARDSAVANSPLADYSVSGIDDSRLSVGLAGVAGILITGLLAFGLFLWLARRRSATGPTSVDAEAQAAPASGTPAP